MLPVSITMFIASALGARLASRFSVRAIVRSGLWITLAAILVLLGTIEPTLDDAAFALSMALLGVGMGFLASQLGKVVQASVDVSGRGEAGGLQFTGQQLGSSLGVALIGAVVLSGLTSNFVSNIQESPEISQQVSAQVSTAVSSGIDFVSSDQIAAAATEAGLDEATTAALVDDYEDGAAHRAQGRPARCRAPRAHLAALHAGPAERVGARRPQARGGECRRLTRRAARGPLGDRPRRADVPAGRGAGARRARHPPPARLRHLRQLHDADRRAARRRLPHVRARPARDSGGACRPHPLTIPELADSAADLLDTLGVERATVLGNSLGCAVLGAFAQRHPDRIERAIMVSPAGGIHNRPLLRASASSPSTPRASRCPWRRWPCPDYLHFGVVAPLRLFVAMTRFPALEAPARRSTSRCWSCSAHATRSCRPWTASVRVPRACRNHATRVAVLKDAAHAINYSHPVELAAIVRQFMADEPITGPAAGGRHQPDPRLPRREVTSAPSCDRALDVF